MDIKMGLRQLFFAGSTAALLVAMPALAQAGGETNIKGLITGVAGNTITIKDSNNVTQTITLTPNTTVKEVSGLVGGQRHTAQQSALIPGLPISADVVTGSSGMTATQINFKEKDLRTAQQIHAGLAPTNQRMNEFGTHETLDTVDVLFASGSAKISAKGKSELKTFAEKAKATKGYLVSTTGYTDSTGSAAKNAALSKGRAQAVHDYLQGPGGLMPARVIHSDGMGVATDAGTGSNANARKVTVSLMQDKGVGGGK